MIVVAARLHVLFQAHPDLTNSKGGDAIQLKATKLYLERLGVQVDFSSAHDEDCSKYDVVHLFNITRPYDTLLQLKNAKTQGKRVCLSTIYWPLDDLVNETRQTNARRFGSLRFLGHLVRFGKGITGSIARHRYREALIMSDIGKIRQTQKEILQSVDMLLPNSYTELARIHTDFPFTKSVSAQIVPNCIDVNLFPPLGVGNHTWSAEHGLDEFVLCVGRIEPRKNQVRLLQAMSDTPYPVVLVGKPTTVKGYMAKIMAAKKSSDLIFQELPQKELVSVYASARVHSLVSYYETPGLSSLEAGAMGCNLAMSSVGSQREYFGERVEYCDFSSTTSIRDAVTRAWQYPWPNQDLSEHIRANYTWERAAEATLAAYNQLV